MYVDSWSEGEPRSRWAFALDGGDGTRRWAFTADTELTGLTAGAGDGRAFVGGENGVVYGLDGSG